MNETDDGNNVRGTLSTIHHTVSVKQLLVSA